MSASDQPSTEDKADSLQTRPPVDPYATVVPADGGDTVLDTRSSDAIAGYELLEPLGEGGMGVVWKARQVRLNRVVALKMVLGEHRVGAKELIRFLAEAEAVASIRHPHVVQVHEYGDANGRPFLAMEYLGGGSLTDRFKQVGRLDPKAAADLLGTIAGAVQAAHDQGIVHRDLKPANVLFDESGQPKVTDFGIAKRAGDTDLTATQAVMGTPAYMAPEQARGDTKFVGPQADVYSLGVILYEALTGARPFHDASQMVLLRKVVEETPERPSKRVAGLPRDIELICLKCLEKDPAERYPTAGALATDLRLFAAGLPVSIRAAGLVERAAKWTRRKPTLAAAYILGLLAVLLGGLGGVAVWQWGAADRARAVAVTERAVAVTAKDDEAKLREKFERFEYGRTMQVAHREWRENHLAATVALLEGTRPDLRGWEWHYLYRLCHPELLTFKDALGSRASFSPDGSRILMVSRDGSAKVCAAGSGAEVLKLGGNAQPFVSAAFNRDGSRILTVGSEAKIWDARSGALIFKVFAEFVRFASFDRDGSRIITVDGDNTVKVWDVRSGAAIVTLAGKEELGAKEKLGAIDAAWVSPDSSRVVTHEPFYPTVRIWDGKTGAELNSFGVGGLSEGDLPQSFSPDGLRIVLVDHEGTVSVRRVEDGVPLLTIEMQKDSLHLLQPDPFLSALEQKNSIRSIPFLSAAFSPDGTRILVVDDVWKMTIRDARDGAEVATPLEDDGFAPEASFSPDGSKILAGIGHSVRVWDVKDGLEVCTLKGHADSINSASFSPDGQRVVTASTDGTVRIWDVRSGSEILEQQVHPKKGEIAENVVPTIILDAMASIGTEATMLLAVGADGNEQRFYGLEGAETVHLKRHIDRVSCFAFSPDRSRSVHCGRSPTLNVREGGSDASSLALKGHSEGVLYASFSPDSSRILTASSDKTAKVWDASSGIELFTLDGHPGIVWFASFVSDGSRIVTLSGDQTLKLWDARNGANLLTLARLGDHRQVCLDETHSRIFTSGSSSTKMWDARTGVELLSLLDPSARGKWSTMSPDGSRIVTYGRHELAKLWDASSGADLLTLKDFDPSLTTTIAFSLDGSRIVAKSGGEITKAWDSRPVNREIRTKGLAVNGAAQGQ